MKTLSFADYVPEPLQHLTETTKQDNISDFIYCLAMEKKLSNQQVRRLCEIAGVSYPPQQLEVV